MVAEPDVFGHLARLPHMEPLYGSFPTYQISLIMDLTTHATLRPVLYKMPAAAPLLPMMKSPQIRDNVATLDDVGTIEGAQSNFFQ